MTTLLAAATIAVGLSSAYGKLVQQERYPWYYADGLDKNDFWGSNSVAAASPSKRINSFEPSMAQRTFINSINFKAQKRPVETRVFRGLMKPSACAEGDYIFRLTSDDAAHLFFDDKMVIDNSGSTHGPIAKTYAVSLRRHESIKFELWWGNSAQGSTMKIEYCIKQNHGAASELLRTLDDGEVGQAAFNLLSNEELANAGCSWTTDLEGLFEEMPGPYVKRCDYKGAVYDGIAWIDARPQGTLDKFLPEKCAYEVGGMIGMDADSSGIDQATFMTTTFIATIQPRATGVHTFWAQADDGCLLFIEPTDGKKTLVVDNGGRHGPEWKHGSITLVKGKQYTLKVYWGNDKHSGKLRIQFEDPLTEFKPMPSIAEILV